MGTVGFGFFVFFIQETSWGFLINLNKFMDLKISRISIGYLVAKFKIGDLQIVSLLNYTFSACDDLLGCRIFLYSFWILDSGMGFDFCMRGNGIWRFEWVVVLDGPVVCVILWW